MTYSRWPASDCNAWSGPPEGAEGPPQDLEKTLERTPGSHLPGGPPTPSSSQAALLGSSAPSQGSTCIDRTPEVTARLSVKMEVLQESSEPQLLLALSETWGRPSGGHLRGQGAWVSLLRGSLSEVWPGHPAAVWHGVQTTVVLVCRKSLKCSVLPLAGSQHRGSMGVSPATRGSCATDKQLPVALDRGTAQGHSPPPCVFSARRAS